MKTDPRNHYIARETFLILLYHSQITAVSYAESAAHPSAGAEFTNLARLTLGLQRAPKKNAPKRRVLPKQVVQLTSSEKKVTQLPADSLA